MQIRVCVAQWRDMPSHSENFRKESPAESVLPTEEADRTCSGPRNSCLLVGIAPCLCRLVRRPTRSELVLPGCAQLYTRQLCEPFSEWSTRALLTLVARVLALLKVPMQLKIALSKQ